MEFKYAYVETKGVEKNMKILRKIQIKENISGQRPDRGKITNFGVKEKNKTENSGV